MLKIKREKKILNLRSPKYIIFKKTNHINKEIKQKYQKNNKKNYKTQIKFVPISNLIRNRKNKFETVKAFINLRLMNSFNA
jgi:hypothetical protein